jgi:hypothetical protein
MLFSDVTISLLGQPFCFKFNESEISQMDENERVPARRFGHVQPPISQHTVLVN